MNRAHADRPTCPTPWKRAFTSRASTARSIRARRMTAEPYRCPCHYWHPRTPRAVRHAMRGAA